MSGYVLWMKASVNKKGPLFMKLDRIPYFSWQVKLNFSIMYQPLIRSGDKASIE